MHTHTQAEREGERHTHRQKRRDVHVQTHTETCMHAHRVLVRGGGVAANKVCDYARKGCTYTHVHTHT